MFSVGEKLTLSQIYALIEQELRSQYSLGYAPREQRNGFRSIKLRTRKRGLTVQTRTGYYARGAD
jgi:hypothetical protein